MNGAEAKYLIGAVLLSCVGVVGVIFFFAPDQYSFYPRCLFHSLTGLQCAGCGGLRATHRLLHGDIAGAFHFNPFLVLCLPIFLGLGVSCARHRMTGREWRVPVRRPFWLWFFLAAVVVFAIARNF